MNMRFTRKGPMEAFTAKPRFRARTRRVALPAGLAVVQLVLAYEWLISGINKLTNANFTVQLASNLHQSMSGNPYSWYVSFLREIVLPHAGIFGLLTELGELSIGITLLGSAVLWLRRPHGRLTLYAGKAACLALAGAVFLPLNFFLMSGDSLPWINSANAFNEGVTIDALIPLLSVALLMSNLQAVRSARTADSDRLIREGGTSWAA